MRIVSAADLARAFTFPTLIEALREAFVRGAAAPQRAHHTIPLADEPDATLLLMPAWNEAGEAGAASRLFLGVKIVAVYPGNPGRNLPSVQGTYMLMDGKTGEPLAVLDGSALTLWRTAAASALAASYLAREDSTRLVMVGAGALAPYLIRAHASVRPIGEVLVWNRSPTGAERVAHGLSGEAFSVRPATDLETAVRQADVVSCATLSSEPLVRGEWLKPGAHLDLVGAFTPSMRECDEEAVRRARVFVDTRGGALKEAGDLLFALRSGALQEADVVADLAELCRANVTGRITENEITLFKSVGAALEDLAAATLAVSSLDGTAPAPVASALPG